MARRHYTRRRRQRGGAVVKWEIRTFDQQNNEFDFKIDHDENDVAGAANEAKMIVWARLGLDDDEEFSYYQHPGSHIIDISWGSNSSNNSNNNYNNNNNGGDYIDNYVVKVKDLNGNVFDSFITRLYLYVSIDTLLEDAREKLSEQTDWYNDELAFCINIERNDDYNGSGYFIQLTCNIDSNNNNNNNNNNSNYNSEAAFEESLQASSAYSPPAAAVAVVNNGEGEDPSPLTTMNSIESNNISNDPPLPPNTDPISFNGGHRRKRRHHTKKRKVRRSKTKKRRY